MHDIAVAFFLVVVIAATFGAIMQHESDEARKNCELAGGTYISKDECMKSYPDRTK
jgi:hypothetical protein